jgi:hypothetical protein
MRWFRSNRLFGGWLALFALGLQFVVSFAHVHAEDFVPASAPGLVSQATTRNAATDGIVSAVAPADDHGKGLPHDDCPICASIYLISNGLIGQPPLLSAPSTFILVSLPSISDFDFKIVRYFSFQTRAPPIA